MPIIDDGTQDSIITQVLDDGTPAASSASVIYRDLMLAPTQSTSVEASADEELAPAMTAATIAIT